MSKLYFESPESEICQDLESIKDQMRLNGITEQTVYEAMPEKDADYFWCRALGAPGEPGDCGKHCDLYEPRNGKSGCCTNLGSFYICTDKQKVVKVTKGK